jgi:CheY-like chemotaxis protein
MSALTVLVVEDEENIRNMLSRCLECAGFSVSLACSGEDALAAARTAFPEVALVDLRLGGVDGLAVIRTLSSELPATASVLMTAYAAAGTASEALRAGAVACLPKPFTPADVLRTVRYAVLVASERKAYTCARQT